MGCYGEQSFLPQGTSYLIARIADCDGSGTACRAPTCTSFFIALHIGLKTGRGRDGWEIMRGSGRMPFERWLQFPYILTDIN